MEPVRKTGKIPYLPVVAGLMILVPVLLAAGCTGSTPVSPGSPLNGSGWILAGYAFEGTSREVLDGTSITLDFSDNRRITGSAGCNHYFANYVMTGSAVTIGQAGSTEMYCMAPGVMEQESVYLALLSRAASVTAGNDTLTFADTAGSTILTFARKVPPVPAPLVGTNWTLDSLYANDAVSSVISGTTINALFDRDGSVTGSAGCNHYFGSYNVTGNSIVTGSLGSTKMYCNAPGIMQQESSFLASMGRTATYTISGNRLILADANGTTILSFTREP